MKPGEANLTCVFMKAVQRKMLFSCIEPDYCVCDAALHLKANVQGSYLFLQQIFPRCIHRIPVPGTAVSLTAPAPHREGELLAKPNNWHGSVVHGLPGAREQIHRQQLGLSLKADANKYAMYLTEFL